MTFAAIEGLKRADVTFADIILFFSNKLGEAITALEVAVTEVVNVVLPRHFSITGYSSIKREIPAP